STESFFIKENANCRFWKREVATKPSGPKVLVDGMTAYIDPKGFECSGYKRSKESYTYSFGVQEKNLLKDLGLFTPEFLLEDPDLLNLQSNTYQANSTNL
ncbi:255_t:CDS:1, partial [Ambispora leptoticha]